MIERDGRKNLLAMFDFDGVVADSLAAYVAAHERIFEHFGKPVPFTDFQEWYDSVWENNWLKEGFKAEEIPLIAKMCIGFVDYRKVQPFAGMAEVMRELSRIARLTVVSTTPAQKIRPFLEEHGMACSISAIYSPRAGSAKRELMRSALREAGAPPERAVMIGDTSADIVPAGELGCRTAGVTYGWYGPRRMKETGPDRLIDSPCELLTAVPELLGATAVA